MPEWYCRQEHVVTGECCQGPRHDECGLRYRPGEYTVNGDGSITLREIGTIRAPGLPPPALIPRSAVVILYQDGGGWAVEIEPVKESQS